jgi:general secretion pathway protein G
MRYFLSTLGWLAFIVVGLTSLCIALLPPRLSDGCPAEDAAHSQIAMLCDAVELYTMHVGALPPDLQALRAAPDDLAADAGWQGPYLNRPIPVDPWGNDFRYQIDGRGPGTTRIWSCGRDGISGTDDDIEAETKR